MVQNGSFEHGLVIHASLPACTKLLEETVALNLDKIVDVQSFTYILNLFVPFRLEELWIKVCGVERSFVQQEVLSHQPTTTTDHASIIVVFDYVIRPTLTALHVCQL